jgi:thioredoxin 1|tara:strand:+ start:5757 stop:6074 length:318 start_codon:yes stop_codon:yes gene_type:complete
MTKKIIELNAENFDSFIESGNCVIDFYADWCGPCKMLTPEFEKASENIENVKFGKVDIDGSQELAGRFQVMSIPTILFFKGKKQVDRHNGLLSSDDIRNKVDTNF